MKILKLSLLFFLIVSNYLIGQITSEEKLSLMQSSLLLGLEEKGIDIGSEILSIAKYKSVKEKALFTLAEYFFSKGVLGKLDKSSEMYNENMEYINKSYTFYDVLLNKFPNGQFIEIAKNRIKYLRQHYRNNIVFRLLGDYLENEKLIVNKKLDFVFLFINKQKESPFLFFTEGKEPNTYELITKYFNDIIVNNPELSIYSYYYKLLVELSRDGEVEIITSKFEEKSLPKNGFEYYSENEIEKSVIKILTILTEKFPSHPLTIQAYLVAVSYLIKAGIWDYYSPEVKKWLKLALKNDNDKLGVKHLVTKEYLLKTVFDEN